MGWCDTSLGTDVWQCLGLLPIQGSATNTLLRHQTRTPCAGIHDSDSDTYTRTAVQISLTLVHAG